MIEARYPEVDGRRGFVEIAGEGEAVLCIHTAGQTGRQWREVLLELPSRGFQVIVPDLPGHGRSDAPPGPPIDDLARYRDWCVALLAELGVGPALLVGCSIGGRIVLDIAAAAPEATAGVVAMEANARHDLVSVRGLQRELQDAASPSRGDRTYYGTLASLGARVPAERAREVATLHRREDPIVSSADLIGWSAHDLSGSLARIDAPVHLVAGSDDFWLDPGALDAMSTQIPDCSAEVLEGVGHYPMEEIPDFPDLLAAWLESLAARASMRERSVS